MKLGWTLYLNRIEIKPPPAPLPEGEDWDAPPPEGEK
jgi:hypothetical protein